MNKEKGCDSDSESVRYLDIHTSEEQERERVGHFLVIWQESSQEQEIVVEPNAEN
jgi:hypothetical protein